MVLGIDHLVCWLTEGRAEEKLMDMLGGHCLLKTICRKANSPDTFYGARAVYCPSHNWRKQEHLLLFFMP